MKWCILISHIPSLKDFLGKLAYQLIQEGESCIVLADSKIGEYIAREVFPKEARIFSRVDWCLSNYREERRDFNGLSWKEFFPDYERFGLSLNNFQKSVKMMSQHHQFIDFILDKEKPNIVLFEPPSGNFSEVAFHLCKKHQIPYLGLILSRFPGRIDVYDLEHTCSRYVKDFQEGNALSTKEEQFAKDFIEKFISHKQLPSYMKYQNICRGFFAYFWRYWKESIKTLRFWLEYILQRRRFWKFDPLSEMQLKYRLLYPLRILKIKIRNLFREDIFDHPLEKEDYFLFPLHIQPEASTLVQATYFYDQVNTVKNIAFSLPFPLKLYVKEHPAVRGDRPNDFYQKLKEIPNVVLLSPKENVERLISQSQGVITLTSTIGMEAALVGKPVYVLGKAFYSHHPCCREIRSFGDLKASIERDLAERPEVDTLEEINLRFVVSYLRNTIPGDICAKGPNDSNNYKEIYRELKRIFL